MNPYIDCHVTQTESFAIRLIDKKDSVSLFKCYHNKDCVELMNDDNCDFGFYVDTVEKMEETVGYWIDFYNKKYFIRFSIVDRKTQIAVGTIEGFAGDDGVLRVDILTEFENQKCLSEIFDFAKKNFYEYFGNKRIFTKAVDKATQRRKALNSCGWKYIGSYRGFNDYFAVETDK